MSKPTLRASSLPDFMVCSASKLNPDKLPEVHQSNGMTELGTHVHALCESTVKTGSADLGRLKQRLPVEDYDRAGMLYRNFLRVWDHAKKYLKAPQTEVYFEAAMSHLLITGHMDVVDIQPRVAYVMDYKAGRMHEDHYHQMAGYAFLVWDKAGRPKKYTVNVTAVYLEDNSIHPYSFTTQDILDWEGEVAKQVEQVRYTASRKCAHCPLATACPAYHSYVAGTLKVLNDDTAFPGKSWEQMTPTQRGELIDRIYVIEKAIDRAKLGLRNVVYAKGAIDVGGGKEYVLVEQTTTFLDSFKGRETLKKFLPLPVLNRISRINLDEALTAYGNRAAKGQKTEARKKLLASLTKAGALVVARSTKMWRRPKGEKKLEDQ